MEITHIVIKKEDALKYLPEPAFQSLCQMLNIIAEGRSADGKKPVNEYYICNVDKEYAEIVHGVIMAGEYTRSKKKCEKCFYYGRPSDAPETVDKDCMYVPEKNNDGYTDYTLPCKRK